MEHQASRCISPRVCKRQEYSAIPGTIATTEWCNRTCRRGSYCPCTLCECAVTCSDGLLNGDFSNGLGGWNVVREADSEGVIKALPDGHQAPLSGKKIPAKSAAVEEAFGDEEDVDSTDYIALFDHASPGSYVLYQEITPARGDVLVFSWFVANYAKNYHIQDETMAANVYRNQQFRVDIVEPFSVELVGPEVEPELTSEPEGEQEKEVEADDDSLEWESSVQWATVKGEKAPAPKYKKQQAKKPVLPRAPAAPARDAAKLNKTGSWFGVDSEMNGAPVLATVLSPEKVRSIMNAVGHPPYRHINPWQTLRYDLSDFDGKTVWLAFRAVNNQGILNVAIDEVSVVNRICNPGPSTPATREAKLAAAKQKLSAPLVEPSLTKPSLLI
ncbi:hypothetical protein BJ742DRAFT_72526 [Cladochytrium replicatum]|nr:hypothetical protein BJ742DRAFT_72526 [Cladochytrium replicatum]